MVQKRISLPEELDRKIRKRVELLQESEERVIQELIEEGLKSTTQDRFGVLDRIRAKNKDRDPEEVEKHVTAVVETVRQELYDEEQAAQGRR